MGQILPFQPFKCFSSFVDYPTIVIITSLPALASTPAPANNHAIFRHEHEPCLLFHSDLPLTFLSFSHLKRRHRASLYKET